MILEELNLAFIFNNELRTKTLSLVEQIKLEYNQPIAQELFRNIQHIEEIDNNSTKGLSIEFNPEKFLKNENDSQVFTSQHEYDPFIHYYNIDYQSTKHSRGEKFFLNSDVYSFPHDHDSSEVYSGFLYLKSTSNQEFVLPCILSENSRLKHHHNFQDEWIEYFAAITSRAKSKYHAFIYKKLYIITKNSTFEIVLDNNFTDSFNNNEELTLFSALKDDLEKEKHFYHLSQKLSSIVSLPPIKKLKI